MSIWRTPRERIREFSERILVAQAPIRILDAIKWEPEIEARFFEQKATELPAIPPDYYNRYALAFDPAAKQAEFRDIAQAIDTELGAEPLGRILRTTAEQYIGVVDLLVARGTPAFYTHSRRLYGSAKDSFASERATVADLGRQLYPVLNVSLRMSQGGDFEREIPAADAVTELGHRLSTYFTDDPATVQLSDGIVADSAAGGSVVKLRAGALFSRRDIDILEVHEGWVHLGTNRNGEHQRVARWLAKGPPRVTATQEGLAHLLEILTFRSFPTRAKKVGDRIIAIDKAEDGADFLEVFEYFRSEGYTESECFAASQRIFRGGVLTGNAPFTKDLSYCKGVVEIYNFLRTCVTIGQPEAIPFLMAGKVSVEDVPLLYQQHLEGMVDFPRYVPHVFQDLSGLAVWMSYSSFLHQLDLKEVQRYYHSLF